MEAKLILSKDGAKREVSVGSASKTEDKELSGFFAELSKDAFFDTGILPLDGTGTLALRQGLGHTQIVYQHAPGIYYMIWGQSEGSTNASEIHVAQPYRIVIGDLIDGQLLGARHFYSPVPITNLDQPLYHCNVPNLNCKGYGGTSVGWICLYHTEDYSGLTLGEKVFKVIERASGHEAYNDNNMSGTDGPRFYKEMYQKNLGAKYTQYNYLWDKMAWQKKSSEEGFEWTLNPDLWIPVKVASQDNQQAHQENGTILTLRMAMHGGYHAYYTDKTQPKPINTMVRTDLDPVSSEKIMQQLNNAFVKAVDLKKEQSASSSNAQQPSSTPNPPQPSQSQQNQWQALLNQNLPKGFISVGEVVTQLTNEPKISCSNCKTNFNSLEYLKLTESYGLICKTCLESHFFACEECKSLTHFGDGVSYIEAEGVEAKVFCKNCHSVAICTHCGHNWLDSTGGINQFGCDKCNPPVLCDLCNCTSSPQQSYVVPAKVPMEGGKSDVANFTLCVGCMEKSKVCLCGLLRSEEDCSPFPGGGDVCGSCVAYNPQGEPIYIGKLASST